MFRNALLAVAFVLATGGSVSATDKVNTLSQNEAIPDQLVMKVISDDIAEVMLDTPYKGFYQLSSKIKNRKMVFSEVETEVSYPDKRWEGLALDIASLVQMPAYSTGSRIDPKATAYVVFFDRNAPGLDVEEPIYLPTSAYSRPNVLAVLLIEHDNHYSARSSTGTRVRSADQNTDRALFFELAL